MATPKVPRVFAAIIAICCLVEALILLGTLLLTPDFRELVFIFGAFWVQDLRSGGIFPGQAVLMFVTYGFLHGGLIHLAMNMISLAAITREMTRLMSVRNMLAIYAVSQIAGAGLFALMAPDEIAPMVGASGAIFGVAAGLVGAAFVQRSRLRQPQGPLIRAVGLIIGLNLALTVLMPTIAWQAHLGGALAGLAMGPLLLRRG
ncbi:rhomboid family intramembrane serine protease (plasmid) [Paracoccus sp. TK19116]|uniref:Rhomboid family intramembrane serine protease n=1 Tax=Paracoccus albicereus TaxID=2922394 RepID=A0ABT1MMJ2_9RHOB|nr:rhomboid family intramembrane serine protease [Paracoccus albicereus]